MYNSRTIHNILAKAAFVCSIPRFCNGLYTLQPATRRSHPTEKTIRETLDHGYRTHGPDGHTVGHRRCRGHQFAEAAECSDEGENQVQHDSDPVRRWGPTDRGLDCPLGGKGKLHTLVPSSWHCDTSHTWGGGKLWHHTTIMFMPCPRGFCRSVGCRQQTTNLQCQYGSSVISHKQVTRNKGKMRN